MSKLGVHADRPRCMEDYHAERQREWLQKMQRGMRRRQTLEAVGWFALAGLVVLVLVLA